MKAGIKDVEHGLESARNDIVESRIGRDLKEGVHKGKEIAGHVFQSVKNGTRDVVTIGKSIEEHPKQFVVGALSSMGENMSLGMWQAPRPDNPSSAYYAGRALGDVGGAIVGALPIAAGGALVGGGDTALVLGSETGVAIPVGLGIAALGTGAVTYGTDVETKSSNGLVNDTNRMLAEVSGESGTKGTGNTEATQHGAQRIQQRGFSQQQIDNVVNNYSQKVYQPGGRTVYAKKVGNFYDVVIKNSDGKIITTVGGNTKSLRNWKDVVKMLQNNGGYSTIPID